MINLKNPALQKIVDEIRESVYQNKSSMKVQPQQCMISRQEVDDTNRVTLPCGHVFMDAALKRSIISTKKCTGCPYCSTPYTVSSLEKRCGYSGCKDVTMTDNQLCTKHGKKSGQKYCDFRLTCGKNKGTACSKRVVAGGALCRRHTSMDAKKNELF